MRVFLIRHGSIEGCPTFLKSVTIKKIQENSPEGPAMTDLSGKAVYIPKPQAIWYGPNFDGIRLTAEAITKAYGDELVPRELPGLDRPLSYWANDTINKVRWFSDRSKPGCDFRDKEDEVCAETLKMIIDSTFKTMEGGNTEILVTSTSVIELAAYIYGNGLLLGEIPHLGVYEITHKMLFET